MHDRRLLGTWKSDRRRTMREVNARADFSAKAKDLLEGITGHLVLRFTRTLCHSDFRGTTKAMRYTVVGRNADGLLVVWPGEDPDGKDTLQHIRFEGTDVYWVSLGAFREFFRRIEGSPKTVAPRPSQTRRRDR